jgi:exodeoxyribonuclease V alpha subunit
MVPRPRRVGRHRLPREARRHHGEPSHLERSQLLAARRTPRRAERRAAPPLDLSELRCALEASSVVGTPETPDSLPLILDDARLYLHRYFDYECRLARSLNERAANAAAASASELAAPVSALLAQLFAASSQKAGAPDWQKIAAITALLGRLTIISGGPGTGKTTTVVNLLACLLEADPDCRIALTAPTGKAAARLTEVILERADHLPDALRARLPTEAFTIHRLLGSLPNGEFRHDAAHELPIDVLVVDEASMLDLALAVHLIEAVPADARIILLGDKDQLAAVESGAVFSELSAEPSFSAARLAVLSRLAGAERHALQTGPAVTANPAATTTRGTLAGQLELPLVAAPPSSLVDCVIWLRRNYRFAADSAIGRLAAATNDGDPARVKEWLENPSDPSLRWINDDGGVPSTQSAQALFHGYAPYIDAVRAQGANLKSIATAFANFRVLCAVRDGPWGVNAINQQITDHFRRTLEHPLDPGIRSEWYPGRPVMVLRNDHVLQLFNGDIGIVLPDADDTLQVYFPVTNGEFRPIAPVRLPEHETAFAMTVHKSQGSEFNEILLVLPAEKNRILTRELLYTAVTRARGRLSIVANAHVVESTVATATQRVSGLMARIRSRST